MSTSVNFKKGKLELKINAELFKDHSFTETTNETTKLKSYELAKLSANVNPKLIRMQVKKYMPNSIDSCLRKWKGEFYLAIIGFREKDVYLKDSNHLSQEFQLPELAVAFKLKNMEQVKNSVLKDSAIIKSKYGYFFWIKDLINEKCYLYFKDDHLLISTKQIPIEKSEINFNTFYLKMDLEKLISSYPAKKLLQRSIINIIQQQAQLKELYLKYKGRSKNIIHIAGEFKLGAQNQHQLVQFLKKIKTVPVKDVISTFTSSSSLIVPSRKKVK